MKSRVGRVTREKQGGPSNTSPTISELRGGETLDPAPWQPVFAKAFPVRSPMSTSNPDHSFRKLLPGFVIPAGTQVVLKVAKALPGGQQFKPPGSVGVVLESPPDNQQPYLVHFADGETVMAYFHELALRRREVEDELGEVAEDLRPWIIYRCQVGSKAFGLASEDSDDDLRGIYLPPARLHWSLRRLPEQLEFKEDERDEVYWEIGEVPAAGTEGQPQRAGDALDATGPAGRRDGPGTAGHAAGVPLKARLQDLLGLRP